MRTAGYLLILLPMFVILVSVFRKSDSFISLGAVFKNHFIMFKSCRGQGAIFYILPLFIAVGLMLLYKLSQDFCESINIITSILLSMLFAICSIIGTKDYSLLAKAAKLEEGTDVGKTIAATGPYEDSERYFKVRKVARETFDAIVVTTFIALVLIFACLAALAIDVFSKPTLFISIASVIIYYLLGVTILNLLLIIKRMEKLFVAML